MPTRILRDGILTSGAVECLSFEAEVFYRRLMSVADDYGRFFAHPAILRAHCYPLRLDLIKEAKIQGWLSACVESGLIVTYSKKSTKYLEINNFRQRRRGDSKFPAPCPRNDGAMTAECPRNDGSTRAAVVGGVVGGVVEGEGAEKTMPESDNSSDALSTLIRTVAQNIHKRHPNRDRIIPVPKIRKKLEAIAKLYAANERLSQIADIDRHHEAWSKSDDWTKDGAQFCKGIEPWLNLDNQKWVTEPPPPLPPKMTKGDELRERLRKA